MKTKALTIICSFLLLLIFAGCTQENEAVHTTQIFALDTVIDLTAYGDNAKIAVSEATKEIYRLEKLFSVTNNQSDAYMLNQSSSDEVTADTETCSLLRTAKDINSLTEGNFDITIYPVLRLWGFTEEDYRVPTDAEIENALASVSTDNIVISEDNKIKLANNAQIDLGGIAKGYIADKAAEAMKQAGCQSGLISLGGNVRTIGEKASNENWNIGIRSPESQDYFATVSTRECSVITSGAYQRNFTEDGITYHHIIDPKTGKPSDSDAVSVTIIGKDGTLCDALSTAIFIGGSDYAETLSQNIPDFEYIVLTKDNTIHISESLRDSFDLTEDYSDYQIIYK